MQNDLLEGLNENQRVVATQINGKFLVLASAGSGKTHCLTKRIQYLISLGVRPWEIVAISFTKKASNEIRERVEKTMGETALDVHMGTFHSLCMRILLANQQALGMQNLTVLDDHETLRIITDIAVTHGYMDEKDIKDIRGTIDRWTNNGWSPEDVAQQPAIFKDVLAIFEEYTAFKKTVGYVDFNDILLLTSKLFAFRPDILAKYANKYKYLIVDEAQDMNNVQFRLVQQLSSAHQNYMLICDDLQAIFGFRGSNVENIINIRDFDPEVQTLLLERNYRSTQTIVQASNAFIANNERQLEKVSYTENERGWPIYVYEAADEVRETEFIVKTIEGLMKTSGYKYKDFAILYRSNFLSRNVEFALSQASVPYDVLGGTEFYERDEVKTLVAYLRALDNPMDDLAFERIINRPKRSIGDATINRIKLYAASSSVSFESAMRHIDDIEKINKPTKEKIRTFLAFIDKGRTLLQESDVRIEAILRYVILSTHFMQQYDMDKTDDISRVENIQELYRVTTSFDEKEHEDLLEGQTRMTQFLTETALFIKEDQQEDNQVSLMTCHSSKGLEFPVVFVIGLQSGDFPSRHIQTKTDYEEERRLFYVAMTRAKDFLFLSHNKNKYKSTQVFPCRPSEFIGEIPSEFVRHLGPRKDS